MPTPVYSLYVIIGIFLRHVAHAVTKALYRDLRALRPYEESPRGNVLVVRVLSEDYISEGLLKLENFFSI